MRDKKVNISVRVSEETYNYLVNKAKEDSRSLSSLCEIYLNEQIKLTQTQEK